MDAFETILFGSDSFQITLLGRDITFWGVIGILTQFALIPVLMLNRRKHPSSMTAWLMALLFLPLLGGVLFLVFGINRVERKARRKAFASRAIGRNLPELSQYQYLPGAELSTQQKELMRIANRVAETIPTTGNRIEILSDTHKTLGLIEQAVQTAQDHLHLEYYIWQPDATGTQLRDMLIQRAREGVKVRFLFDNIGSIRLGRKFLKPMRDAGILVARFLPGVHWYRWSLNMRSHRKIVIVDGQTGFTGGMNIGDEYLGKNPQFGYWRDTHLKLVGPAVLQLQQVFAEDWYYATGEELTDPEFYPSPDEAGSTTAQVLAGEPAGEVAVFHQLMFAAINKADKSVTLTTSYFVPTEPLASALESAAYRGVKVRLLLSKRSAHMATVYAAQSYYESLLRAGVEIYEYNRGLLHPKTLTIDGCWSLVGSPNFDARSLLLNFEVGLAMYDSKSAHHLEEDFEEDIEHATKLELDGWLARPKWRIVRENACRLFSPVL